MVIVGQYQFADLRSGKITRTGVSYVAATGSANCATGQESTTPSYWRAYFGFDTSGIPSNAQIDNVVCVLALGKTQPFGVPETFRIKYSIGDIVGATLDGDSTEWDAGTLMVTRDVRPVHGQQINLNADGNDPTPYVNKAGKTDIKIWDESVQGTGDSSWGVIFNRGLIKCYLQISYSLPSATATGKAHASCAAEIIVDATGSATGIGGVDVSATATLYGSATATGIGAATATSTAVRDGTSTVVGTGEALGSAYAVRGGAGTATGVGTARLEGRVVYPPLALHEATISVAPTHSASVSTGIVHTATTSCDVVDTATRGPRRAN